MNKHLVQGKRIDNGEMVCGYYTYVTEFGAKGLRKPKIVAQGDYGVIGFEVDPATVEPVAAKVTAKVETIDLSNNQLGTRIENYNTYYCPSCNEVLTGITHIKNYNYCHGCGQRLDWTEAQDE